MYYGKDSKNISEYTQECYNHKAQPSQKKERWVINKDNTNTTYETTNEQRRTTTEERLGTVSRKTAGVCCRVGGLKPIYSRETSP